MTFGPDARQLSIPKPTKPRLRFVELVVGDRQTVRALEDVCCYGPVLGGS